MGKLMQRTGQLRPGARIGVAASGGADSFTLLQGLLLRKRVVPFPFEVMALHVNPGFEADNHRPLSSWCADNGVALHVEMMGIGPKAHSEENRKNSPCFYCAWFRRKKLFELCSHYGLTHLALGHTADDLVSTFFLNMTQTGKVEGLTAKADYFGGELTLVRPLLLLEKKRVERAARAWNLPVFANPCPSAGQTKRTEMEEMMRDGFLGDPVRKKRIFRALTGWQLDLDAAMPYSSTE